MKIFALIILIILLSFKLGFSETSTTENFNKHGSNNVEISNITILLVNFENEVP